MQDSARIRLHPLPSGIDGRRFDLVVIGAGINGTGVARDAALRGLEVLLLDKGDIASGTSSRSARMIHGGLRYLEHGDIGLVRESLRERAALLRIAPHLVHPHSLLIPIYGANRHRLWKVRLGLTVLDLLAALFRCSIGRHRKLTRDEVLARVPGLDPHDLAGACEMPDAYAPHGERLCVENALDALRLGATVIPYARVDDLSEQRDGLRSVRFRDRLTGARHEARARLVANVAGPWVDRLLRGLALPDRLVGGTKGSFLVVDPFPGAPGIACFYEALSDQRQLVVLPWNGRYLLGTTDDRFEEDPDTATVAADEVDYLLRETNRLFPGARLDPGRVRFAYSGVRPLPCQREGAEGGITRKHVIHDHGDAAPGMISVVGGKLGTFRSLAREVVDLVLRKLDRPARRCTTARAPLPGAVGPDLDAFRTRFREQSPLSPTTTERLLGLYGTRAARVLAVAGDSAELRQPFDETSGAIGAEVLFAFRHERAETLADVLIRRTMVAYDSAFDVASAERATRLAQRHGIWNEERRREELESYRGEAARFQLPRSLVAPIPGERG